MSAEIAAPVSDELLRRYDISGPRYTSYPTADRFVEAFTAEDYAQALTQRRSGPAAMTLPLSLYIHIPFCESLCYYCACNKIITKHHDRATEYLRYLERRSRTACGSHWSRPKNKSIAFWWWLAYFFE